MGCRCIELDCWDGPEEMPFIYHGHTLTTKIKFLDVIKTIKDHAFVTSEYPVILSIENNCSLPQQRKMAAAMQEVFGDMLLIYPVEKNETALPSPYQLRKKIILKHKKLPEGAEEDLMGVPTDELHFSEMWYHGKLAGGRDEAEALLQRYSYLGDGTFLVRYSHTFIGDYSLSFWRQNKVNHCRIKSKQDKGQTKYFLHDTICFDSLYSLITHYRSNPLRSQEFLISLREPVPQPSKHKGMPWFHSQCTRAEAEDMLRRVPNDGAFLVRPSDKDANSYTISFRAERKIKHCRIKQEGRLFTICASQFENLVELISYYEKNFLYRTVKLWQPVNESLVQNSR
ncbi:hypothetical protein B566_EDAN004352, partial [Ephemera danica]